ncbi:MAG: MSMEG_1061 family FMN-dependent PPOX-type flavoprotein [Pseudomonadota bacterium]
MSDEHIITHRDQLRAIVGEVPEPPREKTIDHIDALCARYIAAAPFVVMATRGADGLMDLSPKGDPAGFVAVLDEKTLAIPDRLGNGRFDTYENLLVNPEVGLIFLIPGHTDTLRVSGTAKISRGPELCARFAVNGKDPRFVLLVTVEEAMTHCPKCMVRGGMWQPEKWPDRSNIPTLAEAMVAHGKLSRSVAEMDEIIVNDGKNRLY